jgi:CheY-like chemotaxis protein
MKTAELAAQRRSPVARDRHGGWPANGADWRPVATEAEEAWRRPSRHLGAHAGWAAQARSAGGGRRTILVIDDDQTLRSVLAAALEFEGYEAAVANDGLEALERLRSGELQPALILLDLMLPRMDGYTFAAERRREGLAPGTPTIVLTADARAAEKAAEVDAEGYLAKPFELDDLMDQIEHLIDG